MERRSLVNKTLRYVKKTSFTLCKCRRPNRKAGTNYFQTPLGILPPYLATTEALTDDQQISWALLSTPTPTTKRTSQEHPPQGNSATEITLLAILVAIHSSCIYRSSASFLRVSHDHSSHWGNGRLACSMNKDSCMVQDKYGANADLRTWIAALAAFELAKSTYTKSVEKFYATTTSGTSQQSERPWRRICPVIRFDMGCAFSPLSLETVRPLSYSPYCGH